MQNYLYFYENNNKTLPLGMDLSTNVIVMLHKLYKKDMDETKKEKNKETIYILSKKNEFDFKVKKIEILCYEKFDL